MDFQLALYPYLRETCFAIFTEAKLRKYRKSKHGFALSDEDVLDAVNYVQHKPIIYLVSKLSFRSTVVQKVFQSKKS